MNSFLSISGRVLIALLFLGGAVQKVLDPAPVQQMIAGIGLPTWLVWPVALFNLIAAICLVSGPQIRLWALALAAYCLFTSWFHWQLRADPWQVTIMVKNWAIAGGLLAIAAQNPRALWRGWKR
ncbi:DoxX family protein [Rhodobium gokarnense]|uniref:Oxidoreductase n=1 Tax=Rhodobium gokarnense TaxID=364296 RepID=A0ABT3HGT8_9HYPH|nr:DoxX family protein [Rhodobium gokarnense]MCW2309481.1 putative oxidoreductase [Rhodobium gokarnense]